MIIQLHHEYQDGRTEFVSQREFDENLSQEELNHQLCEWRFETQESHPVPENCIWHMCTEGAPNFMRSAT